MATMKKSSHFVSDLHLFSKRSSADKWEDSFLRAIAGSHTFVLGGDIFDFRWSTQQSLAHAIDDAVDWLRKLTTHSPECNFHYLLGNHDCHPQFVEALDDFALTCPQLVWHRHWLRIEQVVFLHGDVVDTKVRHGEDYHEVLDAKRLAGELRTPPTAFSHAMYDAAVRARVHRLVVQLAKPKEMVLRRLARYLDSQHLNASSGVNEVFFGHTHRRLSSEPFHNMRFHNPGATIKGLPFHLIETNLPIVPLTAWKSPSTSKLYDS
jgi:UDP-2,3-diacylglucosamine pyrophosphatase LpxH